MEGVERKCDGAAAAIVCATEMIPQIAKNLKHKPIEVLGIGCSALEATNPHFEIRATEEAVRQVYELTGVKPEELDLFFANDFIITSHLVSAEIAGYLPYAKVGNISVKAVRLMTATSRSTLTAEEHPSDMPMRLQVWQIFMKRVCRCAASAASVR